MDDTILTQRQMGTCWDLQPVLGVVVDVVSLPLCYVFPMRGPLPLCCSFPTRSPQPPLEALQQLRGYLPHIKCPLKHFHRRVWPYSPSLSPIALVVVPWSRREKGEVERERERWQGRGREKVQVRGRQKLARLERGMAACQSSCRENGKTNGGQGDRVRG